MSCQSHDLGQVLYLASHFCDAVSVSRAGEGQVTARPSGRASPWRCRLRYGACWKAAPSQRSLVLLLALTSPVQDPKVCAGGSGVLCRDLKTAVGCGALKHCQQMVWSKPTAVSASPTPPSLCSLPVSVERLVLISLLGDPVTDRTCPWLCPAYFRNGDSESCPIGTPSFGGPTLPCGPSPSVSTPLPRLGAGGL